MIFQKVPLRCECCTGGCLCGDCSGCQNLISDEIFLRNVKRISILCCLLVAIGFAVFAPVVSLEADVPAVGGFPVVTAQTNATHTTGLGSITFCLLGQGALLIHGAYYPLTKSTARVAGSPCPALRVKRGG